MSTWTAPITFTAASVLTAAQMNAEVRDHLTFLKGALDQLTNGTTADTGTATYFSVVRTASTDYSFLTTVTGDTTARWSINAAGRMDWSAGSGSLDTNFYRSAADTLKSDDGIWAVGGLATTSKAGIPTDADLVAGMQQVGAMILDTTNNRIYFRTAAATWKYAALT